MPYVKKGNWVNYIIEEIKKMLLDLEEVKNGTHEKLYEVKKNPKNNEYAIGYKELDTTSFNTN